MNHSANDAADEGTVLVVDDETGPRESLKLVLRDSYTVIAASGGDEGIALLREHPVDVVVLDLRMPGKTGLETLEEIRTLDPDIPVIILTGYGTLDDARKATHHKAFEFLTKPFDVFEMKNVIDRAMEKRRSQAAAKAELRKGRLLREIEGLVAAPLDLKTLLDNILNTAALGLKADTASVFLRDETTGELAAAASYGIAGHVLKDERHADGDGSVTAWVADAGTPLILAGNIEDERFRGANPDITCALSGPLSAGDEVLGVMNVTCLRKNAAFSGDDLNLFSAIARQTALLVKHLRLQQQLVRTQKQLILQERIVSLAELSAGIAHELATPLNAIYGLAELVRKGVETPADGMEKIEEQTVRASRIIEGLKRLSRQKPPEAKPVSVNPILDAAISLLNHRMVKENVKLHKDLAAGLPDVFADETQLQQIFINLLNNALDALSDSPEIVIATSGADGNVVISITDRGRGIRLEDIPRIFDSFFTTKKEGTGLGLSIVKNLVEANGGAVRVESETGKQTMFTLTFPEYSK